MVYDPIRDCEVPSPAASMHNPSPWADTPNSELHSPGPGHGHGQYPPHFQHDRRSPAAGPTFRSTSGGLRGLLNEEGTGAGGAAIDTRASSGRESYSSTPGVDDPAPPPPRSRSITQLLHDGPPPLSQSSSHSSVAYSTHSHQSPVGKPYSLLDHDGFLAPTTPASGYPRPSRSPHSFNSPSGYSHAPLPPADMGHHRSPYPQMSEHGMPLRSPSISVSPRQYYQSLPPHHPNSRPGSSSSAGGFAYNAPGVPLESPYARQVSVDHTVRPRSGSIATEPQSRRSSASVAPPPAQRIRSPSPPPKIPYAPTRISAPSSQLSLPITADEIEDFKRVGRRNNPLRSAATSQPPSKAAPSPSPGMRRASGPYENENSYFPDLNGRGTVEQAGPSASKKRKTSDTYGRKSKGNGNVPLEQRSQTEAKKYTGNVALVADHYNARQEVGKDAREFSPIIGLRKFNNWVKSVLIGKFAHRPPGGPGANVLDIGCGKGGDLQKWAKARINRMVALDIAATSVEQARERHATLRGPTFRADFIAHDCYAQSIKDVIPPDTAQPGYFDNVTMQFCMHYAFESPSKARMMLENVTRYMRIGGMFVGTIPDSSLLLNRLNELPEGETTFGNSCYSVRFAERHHKGLYGHAYHFYLQDAVDDVPEYIVDWDEFMTLAYEYGLTLRYKKAFNEILSEEQGSRDFGPLLGRMGVINDQGVSTMDEDQWEAANLYMGFALEKYR